MSTLSHVSTSSQNASSQNRTAEPEFEIRRNNVRALVFRQTTEYSRQFTVAVLRENAPFQIFPSELPDYAFSLADLDDLNLVIDVAKHWLQGRGARA
jgi:hypothetical protein